MWIRTQSDELVNLDSVEYLVVALDDESESERYELQAYTFGSNAGDPYEELYYPLYSSVDSTSAEHALDRVARALAQGESLVDLRG